MMPHETNFKQPKSAKVERFQRRIGRKTEEDKAKREVRRRDRGCRFPLCGCRKMGLALHVSHSRHKGMGGNPKGDRSTPELMLQVCSARHRENRIAIDRGTLWWEPLTDKGANGPVRWMVAGGSMFVPYVCTAIDFEVAREKGVGQLEPLLDWQKTTLRLLADMDL